MAIYVRYCRYHEKEVLRRVKIKGTGRPKPETDKFLAPAIFNRETAQGIGCIVAVFRCPKCSYLEFHDPDKIGLP